jgi:hypothetical protein
MAMNNSPRPEPRRPDQQRTSAADYADDAGDETGWLLAASLIEATRRGDGRPRDELMRILAQMSVERGAETAVLAALGLADVAAVLLEVCADSLKEAPQDVLRDVLAILRDEGGEGTVSSAVSGRE